MAQATGFVSKCGSPPFVPNHKFERIDVYDLESTILLRWWNETRTEVLSEVYMDRREAWVTGGLLQVIANG